MEVRKIFLTAIMYEYITVACTCTCTCTWMSFINQMLQQKLGMYFISRIPPKKVSLHSLHWNGGTEIQKRTVLAELQLRENNGSGNQESLACEIYFCKMFQQTYSQKFWYVMYSRTSCGHTPLVCPIPRSYIHASDF